MFRASPGGSGRVGARITRRRKLVHFVSLESEEPLCGGGGAEVSQPVVNGISVCAACARRMAQQLDGASPVRRSSAARLSRRNTGRRW